MNNVLNHWSAFCEVLTGRNNALATLNSQIESHIFRLLRNRRQSNMIQVITSVLIFVTWSTPPKHFTTSPQQAAQFSPKKNNAQKDRIKLRSGLQCSTAVAVRFANNVTNPMPYFWYRVFTCSECCVPFHFSIDIVCCPSAVWSMYMLQSISIIFAKRMEKFSFSSLPRTQKDCSISNEPVTSTLNWVKENAAIGCNGSNYPKNNKWTCGGVFLFVRLYSFRFRLFTATSTFLLNSFSQIMFQLKIEITHKTECQFKCELRWFWL